MIAAAAHYTGTLDGVPLLITVWADGTAEIAAKDAGRWGPPAELVAQEVGV